MLPKDWNTSIVYTYKYNRVWEDVKFANIIYKLFAFSLFFTHKPLLLSLAPSQRVVRSLLEQQVNDYCLFLPLISNTLKINSS